MFNKYKSYLSSTKDRRVKYNSIVGGSVAITILNMTFLYAVHNLILIFLDYSLIENGNILYFVIPTLFISIHFGRLNYYWNYQQDLVNRAINADNKIDTENKTKFRQIPLSSKIHYISFLIAYGYKFLSMSIILISMLLNKEWIGTDIALILIVLILVLLYIKIPVMFHQTDLKLFSQLNTLNLMTHYSDKELMEQEGNR